MSSGFCSNLIEYAFWLAIAFLVASLLIGMFSAILAFRADKPKFGTTRTEAVPGITPLLEALKGIIEALGSAPAWFALFLAGIFLFWMAGEVYVESCKPDFKRTETVTHSTVVTRTEGPKAAVPPAIVQRPPANRR